MPFDQRRLAGNGQHRRRLRHRQAPQLARSAFAEPGQLQVATGVPVGGRIALALAAHLRAGGLDRCHRAAQPQVQRADALVLHPAACIERQRPAAPSVQQVERLGLAALELQRDLGRRDREHLEADLGDQPERAHRSGQHARDVVPRHVLDHLPAEAQHLALAVDQRGAKHVVAHRAHARTRRAGQPRGHHAADRATHGEVRRLEGQALAFRGQQRLQLGQRRARAHGDDQLARLVARDARERPRVEPLARGRLAVESLGAAPANAQRRGRCRGRADAFDDRREFGIHEGRHVGAFSLRRNGPAAPEPRRVSTRHDPTTAGAAAPPPAGRAARW